MNASQIPWQGIETAPEDRRIDLWAKIWLADGDLFEERRFPDCQWFYRDRTGSVVKSWDGLPKGWRATHWMDIPAGPAAP